ncbi:MAG TPA: hypothetical protein VGD59_02710 [Acidisarcina sp.]
MGLRAGTHLTGERSGPAMEQKLADVTRHDVAILAILLDLFLLGLAALIAVRLLLHVPLSDLTAHSRLPLLGVTAAEAARCLGWFVFANISVAWHYGLYSRTGTRGAWNEQRLCLQACLAAGLLVCGGLYLSAARKAPPSAIAVMVATTAVVFAVRRLGTRYRNSRHYKQGVGRRRILIAGENRVADAVRRQVQQSPDLGYEFAGYVRVPGSVADLRSAPKEVVGTISGLGSIARRSSVDEVIMTECGDALQVIQAIKAAWACDFDLRILAGIYEPLVLHGPLSYFGNVPLIYLHRRRPAGVSVALLMRSFRTFTGMLPGSESRTAAAEEQDGQLS